MGTAVLTTRGETYIAANGSPCPFGRGELSCPRPWRRTLDRGSPTLYNDLMSAAACGRKRGTPMKRIDECRKTDLLVGLLFAGVVAVLLAVGVAGILALLIGNRKQTKHSARRK